MATASTFFRHAIVPRIVLGALIGFVFFAVSVIASLLRLVFIPSVAERVTGQSILAVLLFLVLFVATGAVAGWLSTIPVRLLRFVVIGTLVGALVWTYLTLTWPLTARPGWSIPPRGTTLDAAMTGAALGATGGFLLAAIGWLRRRRSD
jgi:hypothetical protein